MNSKFVEAVRHIIEKRFIGIEMYERSFIDNISPVH